MDTLQLNDHLRDTQEISVSRELSAYLDQEGSRGIIPLCPYTGEIQGDTSYLELRHVVLSNGTLIYEISFRDRGDNMALVSSDPDKMLFVISPADIKHIEQLHSLCSTHDLHAIEIETSMVNFRSHDRNGVFAVENDRLSIDPDGYIRALGDIKHSDIPLISDEISLESIKSIQSGEKVLILDNQHPIWEREGFEDETEYDLRP
ncbi:hypothetical protein Q9L42_020680 (plasmid) [Methylomarinum sp. Ch1-1]|uniref:Uncharacterized protein n=1 Tax=Methylomarinum roseum TaxID=3067653 RepID=A0AAU7P0K4_9GAMM|nr:hypothetical protein [Methylomarinum sp. Ch1-1]MDP4523335.1 hypothetical protein [Methylomarinum sp. Ch1-1]